MESSNLLRIDAIGILCIIIGIFILAGILSYYNERFKDIRYAKMEMARAYSKREYHYWKKKLHTLYWCLIPGLTPGRVDSIRKIFRRGKYSRTKSKDKLFSILLPSVLGVSICSVCLAGSTFAWFTATQTASAQKVAAANYTVAVTVTAQDSQDAAPLQSGSYRLEANRVYKVVLDAGSSTASTGYCILQLADTGIVTRQFKDSITVFLDVKEDTALKVIPQWGSSASKEKKLQDSDTYTYGSSSAPVEDLPKEVAADVTQAAVEPTAPESSEPPAEETLPAATQAATLPASAPTAAPADQEIQGGAESVPVASDALD